LSLQDITSVLRILTSSFLEDSIEVLKDLILLKREGKDQKELQALLVQENRYNKKQIKTLLSWVERYANDPTELRYLFTDKSVSNKGVISKASIAHFLINFRNNLNALKDKNLAEQRQLLYAINNGLQGLDKTISLIEDNLSRGVIIQ
jgi:hypothetical protein